MRYYSLKNPKITVSFREALLSSLAPDGGLLMMERLPFFEEEAITRFAENPLWVAAYEIAKPFTEGDIEEEALKKICQDAFSFPLPLTQLSEQDYIMELFHGPTAAFKDFAARFIARAADYLLSKREEERIVLVATSGDTGGAVGYGFKGMKRVKVFILFPEKGVSSLQRKQLTTIGDNVTAFAVKGDFDTCQAMVKEIFTDSDYYLPDLEVMSANSINVGRVLPQSFYYFWVASKLKKAHPDKEIIFSVPSGNLGNVTGGLLAKLMGAPISRFIVSQNRNHPFIDYLQTGEFKPHKSYHTISNAMDIGHPNNFYRIRELFEDNLELLREAVSGVYFSDEETKAHIKAIYEKHQYILCPHSAVGHLGADYFRSLYPNAIFVTAATAHPAKFPEVVSPIIGKEVPVPENLAALQEASEKVQHIEADTEALSEAILNTLS